MNSVLTSPLARAKETAQPIANLQALAGYATPKIEETSLLTDRDWGTFEGRLASEVTKSHEPVISYARPYDSKATFHGYPAYNHYWHRLLLMCFYKNLASFEEDKT